MRRRRERQRAHYGIALHNAFIQIKVLYQIVLHVRRLPPATDAPNKEISSRAHGAGGERTEESAERQLHAEGKCGKCKAQVEQMNEKNMEKGSNTREGEKVKEGEGREKNF